MAKNIIITLLILISGFLAYMLFGFSVGEKPSAEEIKQADTSNWKTYSNKNMGITFNYPEDMKITESKDSIKLENEKVNIEIKNYPAGNLDDFIKWQPQTYQIVNNMDSEIDTTRIVVRNQLSSPESYDIHLFIHDYPRNPADDGKNLHIIQAITTEADFPQQDGPENVNAIMNSLKFIN